MWVNTKENNMPKIKIMTWNTQGGFTDEQVDALIDLIEEHKFDIIALQEMPTKFAKKELEPQLVDNLDYGSIKVKHTLPGPYFNELKEKGAASEAEFLGVRGSTNVNEDDSYVVFYKQSTLWPGHNSMARYLTSWRIQDSLSPIKTTTASGRESRPAVKQLDMDQLAMRRPYYIQFFRNNKAIHFLCWHTPEGGNKIQALPALRWLYETRFEFIPGRRPGQNIIIAGDLNARKSKVLGALGGRVSAWKSVSATWDHILGYSVTRMKRIKIKMDGKASDHPPVAAEIIFMR
jgi:endonuclease/exonuclease/phosphatase family metal-dependent hydrolase